MEETSEIVETKTNVAEESSKQHVSRERWYGALLVVVFVVMSVTLFGLVAWWGYDRWYLPRSTVKTSIQEISKENTAESASSTEGASATESMTVIEEMGSPEKQKSALDIQQQSVSVFNGGGIKGSAGEVVALLKKEGFQKVTLGNTQKDYVGVTVYFATGEESGANEVKKLLLKRYPKIESMPSLSGDKETSGTPLVVIIGK